METNFVKADSGNLPRIDAIMVGLFFKNKPDFYAPELKNVKTVISSRETYGDDAIAYVQLFRHSGICTIKCRMCPEHKVRAKCYSVTLVVDENNSNIVSCQCHDCAAAAGGCKHAVAFLMWVHRRSEEPSCTSIECYWKKPVLSQVGTIFKYITVEQLVKKKVSYDSHDGLLTEFYQEAKKRKIVSCELLKYKPDYIHTDMKRFLLHYFMLQVHKNGINNVNQLLDLLKEQLDDNNLTLIEKATRTQSKSHLWYELRFGRITASKAYEVSHCKTSDGTLVAAIMGAKAPETKAMKRGRILEASVRKTVEGKLKRKFKTCGLFLSKKYPMTAATPDEIMKNVIIEIKCPTNENTKNNYIKNGTITLKYFAQVQLQMFTSKMERCYFCVADPDYETSHHVEITLVQYDRKYVSELLNKLSIFWINNIYPLLSRTINI